MIQEYDPVDPAPQHRTFFERPTTKHLGVVGLAFMLGLAFGNGIRTREALDGQYRWCRHEQAKAVAGAIERHIEADQLRAVGEPVH